jgi:alpha-tubulin suppressor-like RCC1 family protein
LLTTSNVSCWGASFSGALGYGNANHVGDNESPISIGSVDLGSPASQVVAGNYFTCALLSSRSVRCWGSNFLGQLGYGHTENIGDDEVPATGGPVSVGGSVLQLAAGNDHVCALLATNEVRCWGNNASGQLGYGHASIIGDNELPASAGSVNVGGPVAQIAAGGDHTCALLQSGEVVCWGLNDSGQLGYGHAENIGDDDLPFSAGVVSVGGRVARIVAGRRHTCVLLDTGSVKCWGTNAAGELGYGHTRTLGDDEVPVSVGTVSLGRPAEALSASGNHTCAILDDGALRCWGSGSSGELGYGNRDSVGDNELPSSVPPVAVR